MNKSRLFLFLLSSLVLLTSCSASLPSEKLVKVMIEKGDHFNTSESIKNIKRGEDVSFDFYIYPNYRFASASYSDYVIDNNQDNTLKVTFKNVKYSTVISLDIKKISDKKITYHDSSTSLEYKQDYSYKRLKEKSLSGYDLTSKEGYVPVCWNTKEDFSGEIVSFGSRVPYDVSNLYLMWEKETDTSKFEYEIKNDEVTIKKYIGEDEKVVIPQKIEDKNVTKVDVDAFSSDKIKTLVIPKNMKYIESRAFRACNFTEVFICDSLQRLERNAFPDTVKKVHISATSEPRFAGSYYDTFTDKIDYLESLKNEKKIILFSGSSTRYGYDSTIMEGILPTYKVINMGVYAYVNIKPQLDIITSFCKKDDVILSSPEFDNHCLENQFGRNNKFNWDLFAFIETNYDLLKYIDDISKYGEFFNSFGNFIYMRYTMTKRSYEDTPNHYDDDYIYYVEETYNIQGDFILYRKGSDEDVWLYQPIDEYRLDTTLTPSLFNSLNQVYLSLLSKELKVFFTFFPKNRNCISESSTPEELKKIEDYINENLVVPVISKWEDSILPGTDFYLIDNHLSTIAARDRSIRVANELLPYLS